MARKKESAARLGDLEEVKQKILTKGEPSITGSIADASVIKDGNVYFLSEKDGSIPFDSAHGLGLYFGDARFLSGYSIELNGKPPHPLVANSGRGDVLVHQLTNPEMELSDGRPLEKQQLGLQWIRRVHGEECLMRELLLLENFSCQEISFRLSLGFRMLVEDVFHIRGLWKEIPGKQHPPRWIGNSLHSHYEGEDGNSRCYTIQFGLEPAEKGEGAASFDLTLPVKAKARISLTHLLSVSTSERVREEELPLREAREFRKIARCPGANVGGSVEMPGGVVIHSERMIVNRTLDRSARDLAILKSRIDGHHYFSAGLPWFATLFGRDSLVTALEVLPYDPGIARDTLRLLSRYQGREYNHWKDEEPGKILHELRTGELANLGRIPHTPYYGSADATPLFLILLYEYCRWTGDLGLFEELKENVDRALHWLEADADSNADGLHDYRSSTKYGLINQGWKDSGNGILGPEGDLPEPPLTLIELQAYAYFAWIAMAYLLDRSGAKGRAADLRKRAERIRNKAESRLWLEQEGIFDLGLDGKGAPLRQVSSNAGHALWCGMASNEKAALTVRRLMADDLFCGWGVRSLSTGARGFNPVGYHLGTVWPHDNAILLSGFRRYGFDEVANQLFSGMLQAAIHFENHRLPEVFAGFEKNSYGVPVPYPVACHPQAWAAGTIPYMLAELLGLAPNAFEQRLEINRPVLPEGCDWIKVQNLQVAGAEVDLFFERVGTNVAVSVDRQEGPLTVTVRLANPPERKEA